MVNSILLTSLACAIISLGCLTCAAGTFQVTDRQPDPGPWAGPGVGSGDYKPIMWINIGNHVFRMIACTIVIPESYNLAQDLGQGSVLSGMLIGSVFVASIIGNIATKPLLDPWSQPLNKALVLAGTFVLAFLSVLYAFAADPPRAWGVDNHARIILLFVSRVFSGFVMRFASGPIFDMMAIRTMPKHQMVKFSMWRAAGISLGIGLGPIISSLSVWVLGIDNVRARAAIPMLVVGALQTLIMAALWTAIPGDLRPLEAEKKREDVLHDAADVRRTAPGTAGARSPEPPGEELALRRKLWVGYVVLGMERAMIVSALEAATAFILEVNLGLSTHEVGIMVGCTFLMGMPVLAGVLVLKNSGWLRDEKLLVALAIASVTFTPLLSRSFTDAVAGGAWGFWALLFADLIIFPACYIADGIASGIATKQAIPGSFYSQENLALVASSSQDTVGRFIGPPIARLLIDYIGQDSYALFQLIFAALASLTAFSMMRTSIALDVQKTDLPRNDRKQVATHKGRVLQDSVMGA